MYYANLSVGFYDGTEIDDLADWGFEFGFDKCVDDVLKDASAPHDGIAWIQLDGYDLPDWLYEKVGASGLLELANYVNKNHIANIPALCVWMDDRQYSEPEPWHGFEEHYIGEFSDDAEFGYHIVRERLKSVQFEIPRWLDDLIDYSREFDSAVYWKEDGYYFYH